VLAKDIAVYYGMVSMMDKYIGRILDKLDELGLANDTLVVFSTDHGHFFGQHGLNAKGAFHYEDMVKVPFIARYPGRVPAGTRSPALQSLIDLAPTFLSACGIDSQVEMQGVDQLAVWQGKEESARDHVIVENRHQPTTVCLKTYVDERYKITAYFKRDYGELFDLEEDPGETNNLWDDPAHSELKERLLDRSEFKELGQEKLWMPRIAGA
jgi:arylsulfatase A-like enzyme